MRKSLLLAVSLILLAPACSLDPKADRDKFVKSGQEYLEAGNFDAARIQFLNALKLDTDSVPAHLGLASVYEGLGEYQSAVGELRQVRGLDPDNTAAALRLGRYYLAAGVRDPDQFKEARKLAQEVLDQEPDNVQAMILLGNAYSGQQDFDKSIEALQKAIQSDPTNLDAYLNMGASRFAAKQPEEAERVFKEAVQKHPESVKAFLALGNFYVFSGDFEKAESAFQKAYDLAPQSGQTLLALVRLYVAEHQPDQAVGVLQKAIQSSKDPIPLQISLADFYLSLHRDQDAVDLLQELHSEHPDREDVNVHLAEVQQRLGRTEDASRTVDAFLEKNPNSGSGHLLRGRLDAAENNFDGARAEVDRAIQLRPDLAAAYLLKVDLQQRRGDLAGAEQTARKLLKIDGGNLGGRARLAKLMALLKRSRVDLEHALGEAQTVLSADPGNTDAMTARAEAELGLNRLEEARKDFEALHSKSPDNVFYTHRLGTVAALEGEPDLALKYFHEVLEKNPNLADVINDIVAVMQQQGKTQEILDELDRIAATSDQKALVHTLKGRTYMARQEYERAEAELRQAVELDPDNYQAYLLLGQLRLQENRYDDAVKEVDALLARKPNFAPAYLMKAYFRDAAKDVPGAIQNYRKCLELFAEDSPGYAAAANNLAWLLATKGQSLAEARTLAEKAREEDPDNPHYADTLGWVYYQMGNYTLAVDQLVFSVNQGNRDAPHYYRLGMAYYKMGDALHAKQTLEKALQTSSDFDGADEARQTLRDLGA